MLGSERHAFTAPVIQVFSANHAGDSTVFPSQSNGQPARQKTAMASTTPRNSGKAAGRTRWTKKAVILSVLSTASSTMAQSSNCISLSGSTACSSFQAASVSKSTFVTGLFPFLQYVSDTASFDRQLTQYIETDYVQKKYQQLLGCGNIDLVNTTNFYARFTTSVICNAIIQNSVKDCSLSTEASRPLCADSCAQYAESEAYVAADTDLCPSSSASGRQDQIRADFINCALPADSLSSDACIQGIANEPDNCGYGNSTVGLCSYCASGGINSTDTCCYSSNAETRCANVALPTITPTLTFTTATAGPTASNTGTPAAGNSGSNGLSGGAIAGIVIGSVAGFALLVFLLLMCIRIVRRRRGSQKGSIFNQPSPSRQGAQQTAQIPANKLPQGYEVLPGGRIARMSALEGHSGDSPSRHAGSRQGGAAGAAAAGAAAGFMAGRRRGDDHSSSDSLGESPGSQLRAGVLRPPPVNIRRNGSLSSNSVLAGEDPQSPSSGGDMSSPPGVNSQQSEQLPFFKDYYSQDDIHPGERVAVLWAYQPRAADEFALERGDMLKVVGIWDDGWATGVMMDERADEWEARRQAQRDSGVSSTSGRGRDTSPPASGEIKAFPLVCVCLPEHWRKTIEGDGSTETGSSAHQGIQHS
ncbi:hypothetical protein F5B20DRAFT_406791 [Whalleya microplaca]|nr:hypothetical protein F5B20DRAFT_406791 [Whalleya microplaca]